MKALFILIVIFLMIMLFLEMAHEHDRRLLRLSEHASKQRKIWLIKKCYFETTAKKIRKTLNK